MARILSIEDDETIQHLIGQVLFREGYEMHYAWNGREGYEKILALDPDLILLDLMLPMMNGIELLQKLREDKATAGIPVIIVTAYGDEANFLGHSVRALGAADYLRKPLDVNELARSVKNVLADLPRGARPPALPRTQEPRKGEVRADPRFRTVWIADRLVAALPEKEFALLRVLLESPGPVPRESLLRALGYAEDQHDALKQTVHRLRAHLGSAENVRLKTTADGYEFLG